MSSHTLCSYPRCGVFAPLGQSYCATHRKAWLRAQAQSENLRNRERIRTEPWRPLYTAPEWGICKAFVRDRDAYRCTHVEWGERCDVTRGRRRAGKQLEVHHLTPLFVLWDRAQHNWTTFLPMATNPDICVLLCSVHHREAEHQIEKALREYRDKSGELRYARPRPKPSTRKRKR